MRAVLWIAVAGCGRVGFDPAALRGDATTMADAIASDHLVAWYAMDEVTPTGIVDATGHGHDGLCPIDQTGMPVCPTVVTGKIGNAIRFDGTNIFEVKSTPPLMTTAGFTVAAWIQIAAAPASRACVTTKGLGVDFYNSWALCIEPSRQVFFYTVAGGIENNLFSTANVNPDAWHHVAIRWDGTTKTITVDGVDAGADSATTDFDEQSIWIGMDFDSGAGVAEYTGLIDDLRIYDRALAPAELAQLAR